MTRNGVTRRSALGYAAAGATLAGLGGGATAREAVRRVALVTGCSSGFGRLTALELARSGWMTFAAMRVTDADNAEAAAELRVTAQTEGLPLAVVDMDVRDPEAVRAAVAAAQAAGPISVLVNNAGYILAGSIELHGDADVRAQLETNVLGYHRLVRAVAPDMRERGDGLIVQISSGLGRIVFPTQGWYVATKFALEGMSEALAYELAPFGVDVSIVQPTQYPTQFLENGRRYFEALVASLDDERRIAYAQQVEMTRFGLQDRSGPDPIAVAKAVRDLAVQPTGTRPLRRVVSPEPEGLERINAGLSAAQDAVFADTPFAAWRTAVTD